MRVLIADDSAISRRLLEAALFMWDYDVVVASNGAEAWEHLHAEDAPRLRLLAAIDHNLHLSEVPPEALPGHGLPAMALHWLSPAEVARRFAGLDRALDVLGADLRDRLFQVDLNTSDVQVAGFVGSPANSRTTSIRPW